MALYREIEDDIHLIVIDGFVFLDGDKKGLGAYLFEKLEGRIPVIGVAKTHFRGVEKCVAVKRGKSSKPLFVSSLGVDLKEAASFIEGLFGPYRIPDVIKRADRLTRAQ